MAQTKKSAKSAKTNAKTKKNAKQKDVEIIPDFYKEFEIENGGKVELSLYDREDGYDSVKLVIDEAFIIYCRAIVTEEFSFLSYPSFKAGERFINQAYCFDKSLIEQINDALTAYYFD